jgi:hypothetical protein
MHLKAWLIKFLKTIGVDTRQAIMGIIVVALLATYGGIAVLSKTALNFSIQILNKPTPLWVIVLLVLSFGIYVYKSRSKKQSLHNNPTVSNKPKPITAYFRVGKHKWKTDIYPDGFYQIDKDPICAVHDLVFTLESGRYSSSYQCPKSSGCNGSFSYDDYDIVFRRAKSYIDREVRSKNYSGGDNDISQ